MAQPDDIELMQYADDEVRDRDAFAKHLDDDGRAKIAALGEMRELVGSHLELTADAVPDHKFAAMWREVNKAADEEVPRGIWGKLGAWFDRYRGHVITGMVSAGAVAAVAIVLRPASDDSQASTSSIEVLPAAMRTAPVTESLDTPDGNGTVMNFEDEDGHTTVIWVTPADTVEGI